MNLLSGCYLLIVILFQLVASKKLPSYVKTCRANDPNLSACWKASFEALKPYMTKDLPEINLPQIDPLRLQELSLIQNEGTRNLFLNMTLTEAQFAGTSNFEILESHVTLQPYYIQLRMRFPQFILSGNYKAKGKILLFEFDSDGTISGNFTNVIVNGSWVGQTTTKKGREYISIKPNGMDLKLDGIYIYLDNLFRNNREITDNVNQAINDNIDLLYQDFLPVLKKTLDAVITGYSNRFYATFPKDILYPGAR